MLAKISYWSRTCCLWRVPPYIWFILIFTILVVPELIIWFLEDPIVLEMLFEMMIVLSIPLFIIPPLLIVFCFTFIPMDRITRIWTKENDNNTTTL